MYEDRTPNSDPEIREKISHSLHIAVPLPDHL